MKNLLTALCLLVVSCVAAQNNTGIAEYKSVTKLQIGNISINGGDPVLEAQARADLEKPIERDYRLVFNRTESIYEEQSRLDNPAPGQEQANGSIITNNREYRDLKKGIVVMEKDLYSKEFIVTDSVLKINWTLQDESKNIGGYKCFKAIAVYRYDEQPADKQQRTNLMASLPAKENVITAWYAPEIPYNHGPGEYLGLPGFIMEVNAGSTNIYCTKLTLNPKEKIKIKAPDKGEKVTWEEFLTIKKKKREERDAMQTSRRRN